MARFEDLATLKSFGFRGEALSSLCSLCDLSVVTRTREQARALAPRAFVCATVQLTVQSRGAHEQEAGTRLEYDHAGRITSSSSAPRAVGTTVVLKDLFKTLPVRHKARVDALSWSQPPQLSACHV